MKKLLLLAVLLISLVACQQSTTERQQVTKAQREKLRQENAEALKIAVMPTLDCLPLYVAQELRLFDTLHVDVRLKPFTAQMDADTAIVGGSVEGIMSDLVRMERLKRKGLKLDYLSATNLQWQLISNKTARLKQLNQLGDKMVAMTRFSATDYLTDESLKGVKTKSRVYKVQINDVHVRLHLLLNNEMDAMWLTEPQATTARLYHHQVMTDSEKTGTRLGVLAFRTDSIKGQHRTAQLKAFGRAYNMAVDSINKHGVQHFSTLIRAYCNTDQRTVNALPKLKFNHLSKPDPKDIEKAQRYVK